MPTNGGVTATVAVAFLVSMVAVLPSGGATSHAVSFDDAAGDVQLYGLSQDAGVPATNGDMVQFLDLTKVTFGRETGHNFTVEFTVAGMQTTQPTTAGFMPTTNYLACFTYAGVPYGATAWVIHNTQDASRKTVQPGHLFVPSASCSFEFLRERTAEVALSLEDVSVNVGQATLALRLQRKDLANLHGLAGTDERSPQAGDTLTDLRAETYGSYGVLSGASVQVPRVLEGADEAGPAAQPFAFTVNTANELLEIRVKTNTVDRGTRVPEYSVDAGGFQAIPVEVINRAREAKNVNLTVALEEGAAAQWTFSLVPFVRVPGLDANGDEGLRVVTLVVEPKGDVKHLDKARVAITAAFADQPTIAGSIAVNVRAIFPPGPASPTMWLHRGTDEFGNARMWMNTLKDDAREFTGPQADYNPSDGNTGTGGGTAYTIFVDPDVQPSKDLILNAQVDVPLYLNLTSSSPANVEILAFVENGEGRIVAQAEGRHAVGTERTAIVMKMVPRPESRDDDELRVEAGVDKGMRLWIRIRPQAQSGSLPVIGGVGQTTPSVTFTVKGASMTLPILRVEAPGLTNISAKGARVSLNLVVAKDLHVNPGKTKALNFTVLNEGVKRDTVTIRVAYNLSSGWGVRVLPTSTFQLDPGIGDGFTLFVTPPTTAEEDDRVLLEVLASSRVDPSVVSKQRFEFVVTEGVEIADEGGLADGLQPAGGKKKGGVPGFEALAALAALGAAVLLAGRRRV